LSLVIVFLSYRRNEIWTLFVAMLILFCYEYLRFFKLVATNNMGYFREIVFGILIMLLAFFFFRKIKFLREN
jgi:hypothetical protein